MRWLAQDEARIRKVMGEWSETEPNEGIGVCDYRNPGSHPSIKYIHIYTHERARKHSMKGKFRSHCGVSLLVVNGTFTNGMEDAGRYSLTIEKDGD